MTTVLRGARLTLRRFTADDVSERYLGWLSNPEVNRHSRRFGQPPVTRAAALEWLAGLHANETVFAVEAPEFGHIGNVKYGPVDHHDGRADISILLGERPAWGRGFGAEAVYLVARHLFEDLGLNRVDAGSANPAFIAMVKGLGWKEEGVLRQRVRIGDRLVDWTLLAQLAAEFRRRTDIEASP